jgi:hypothetical protein
MSAAKHPLRIFGFSAFATIVALVGVLIGHGLSAALVTLVLIAVELTFSFDNAIINAKVLATLSRAWQLVFLTAGMVVAIFGMRVIFPILIVTLTAHLPWLEVTKLALHNPKEYAHYLEQAHVAISSFGGAFLLMLSLEFFMDKRREILWLKPIERPLQRIAKWWLPPLLAIAAISVVSFAPFNHHSGETFRSALTGIITFAGIQLLIYGCRKLEQRSLKGEASKGTSMSTASALVSLLYLEILDASFSFDGVIGAFAITNEIILIAIGLGVGALWVRSLTVYMVHRGTLESYRYLEHGAHYAIFALASVMFISLFVSVPEVITGLAGIGLIVASLLASIEANKQSA